MTPKQKAKKLFDKYEYYVRMYNDDTPRLDMQKQCALIAVDEMLSFMFLSENENSFWINFYNKVKQEIEKL
jgi:hypothetical protein